MKPPLIIALILLLTSCQQRILGLSRGDRVILYGEALDVAGHPEIGIPAQIIGQRLKTLDKQPAIITP